MFLPDVPTTGFGDSRKLYPAFFLKTVEKGLYHAPVKSRENLQEFFHSGTIGFARLDMLDQEGFIRFSVQALFPCVLTFPSYRSIEFSCENVGAGGCRPVCRFDQSLLQKSLGAGVESRRYRPTIEYGLNDDKIVEREAE